MELATLGSPQPVETIFIGGGTPTYLSPRQLERLLMMVRVWLPFTGFGVSGLGFGQMKPQTPDSKPEFSIESTPESITPEKVNVLADHGVNRVSLGVQSFNERTLAALERVHTPGDVPRAIDCVRRRIDNLSLDLIFGVPGQTLAHWQQHVDRALAF